MLSLHLLRQAEDGLHALGESNLARHWAGLRETINQRELRVVVFGEFNRGKSTLINALLGRVVLPAKLIPTTGYVTRIVYGPEEVRVQYRDGRVEICALSRLDSFSGLDRDGRAREDVAAIEVAVEAPLLLRRVVLLDTPGVSEADQQTARARLAIAQADLVLFLLDARQLLTGGERTLAIDWLVKRLHKPLAPVVNFWNQVPEEEKAALRSRLQGWTRSALRAELGKAWFEVNALGALRHVLGLGAPPGDDTAALGAALGNLTKAQRLDLKRRGRLGQVRTEVRALRPRNMEVLERLGTNARRLKAERAARRADLERLARRLEADAKIRRERLTALAEAVLSDKLNALTTITFKGESKSRLESYAQSWYSNELSQAVRAVETGGQMALSGLAGDQLGRPEQLTIAERLQLKARLLVGELTAVPTDGKIVAGGVAAGAVIGTFLLPIPGVGTALGGVVGGFLANLFGQKQPDYVAAYSALAREHWAEDKREVLRLLQGQFDARVAELGRHIQAQLDQINAVGVATDELQKRQTLEAVLARCEMNLKAE